MTVRYSADSKEVHDVLGNLTHYMNGRSWEHEDRIKVAGWLNAAYAEGQKEMRGRAAQHMKKQHYNGFVAQEILKLPTEPT
jgi:hypothetical protein